MPVPTPSQGVLEKLDWSNQSQIILMCALDDKLLLANRKKESEQLGHNSETTFHV